MGFQYILWATWYELNWEAHIKIKLGALKIHEWCSFIAHMPTKGCSRSCNLCKKKDNIFGTANRKRARLDTNEKNPPGNGVNIRVLKYFDLNSYGMRIGCFDK